MNKKWAVDTNIFNWITEDKISLVDLPQGEYVATSIQRDELEKTSNPQKRKKLLSLFSDVILLTVATETAIFDISSWDEAKWSAEDGKFEEILSELDLKEKKPNNIKDALIGETALKNNHGLITADKDFYEVMKKFGVESFFFSPPPKKIISLLAHT